MSDYVRTYTKSFAHGFGLVVGLYAGYRVVMYYETGRPLTLTPSTRPRSRPLPSIPRPVEIRPADDDEQADDAAAEEEPES